MYKATSNLLLSCSIRVHSISALLAQQCFVTIAHNTDEECNQVVVVYLSHLHKPSAAMLILFDSKRWFYFLGFSLSPLFSISCSHRQHSLTISKVPYLTFLSWFYSCNMLRALLTECAWVTSICNLLKKTGPLIQPRVSTWGTGKWGYHIWKVHHISKPLCSLSSISIIIMKNDTCWLLILCHDATNWGSGFNTIHWW